MTEKPRVLQVITHLSLGGAEKVSFDIMTGLAGDFSSAVFACGGIKGDAVAQRLLGICADFGIPIFTGTRIPSKYGGLLLSGWRLSRVIRRYRPHLVHLHTEIPEAAFAIAASVDPGCCQAPILRTIHNTVYWTPHRWLGRWSERRIDTHRVVCVSQGARDAFHELRQESGATRDPAPVDVIYNGVRDSAGTGGIRNRREQRERVRVMYAGRFEYQKGVDLIRDALIQAAQSGVPGELILYGAGRLSSQVSSLQEHPPEGWTVEVREPVASLEPLFPTFDLLILPSRFEGLALIAVEALLAGLPVIGTDAPGLREVLPAGYPWIAPAGDAAQFGSLLGHAMSHPERWREAASGVVPIIRERFAIDKMLGAYKDCYDEALRTTQPGLSDVVASQR